MNRIVTTLLTFGLFASSVHACELIFSYKDFGPQAMVCELIGMEWWQWESHGDSRPRDYPIRVIVYWDEPLANVQKRHPVNPLKQEDFRYIERLVAVQYLEKTICEVKRTSPTLDIKTAEVVLKEIKSVKVAEIQSPVPP